MSGGKTLKKNPRRSDTIPKRKSGKARIEAPMGEARSSPPAHRGARVIRADALRFMLILQEPRGGQERKQDSEDDPDINAHQSSPAGALPTNSSLTDPLWSTPLSGRGSCANRIGIDQTVFVLISTRGATRSPQRSLPCVGYLVQDVLHARGLR